MIELPFGCFIVISILMVCLGLIIAVGIADFVMDRQEEKQAQERQAYLDSLMRLNLKGLDARENLISSALETMKNEKRR